MAEIVIEAEPRQPGSSNVARRLRRAGRLPVVVYGGSSETHPISVDPRAIIDILKSESGQNTVFQLKTGKGGSTETVMLFDLQIDPITHDLVHADLMRIAMDKAIEVSVPLVLVGEAKGVRVDGGVLDQSLRELVVTCLPSDIPDGIELDVSELKIGDAVRVSDLKVPSTVTVVSDPERSVASVVPPVSEEDLEAVVVEPFAEEAEPELVGVEPGEKGEEAEPTEEPAKQEAGESE